MSLPGFAATRVSLLASLSLLAVACGGSNGASLRDGRVEVLLSNTPARDLASFHATIEDVRLLSDTGDTTGNLIAAPVAVEFLGLNGRSAVVASGLTGRGTFQTAQITFQEGSLRAISKDGTDIPVLPLDHTVEIALAEDAVVVRQGHTRVLVDLDLRASIDDGLSPHALGFAPVGSGTGAAPGPQPVDDFKGIVLSSNETAGKVTVQAFLDEDLTTPVRQMAVLLETDAWLEDENDMAFPDQAAFFASLVNDSTLLELHGWQDANGVCHAQRVEIEDHVGGVDADEQVKIEGYVTGVDQLGMLQLAIQEVEQGTAIADGVLSALGDPTTIDVSFGATLPVFEDLNVGTTPAALTVGQRVKVKFSDFVGAPFPARSIEIVGAAAFEAEVQAVLGANLDVTFSASDFGVLGGLVADDATTVEVDLTGATILLDVAGRPALSSLELRRGQQATVEGTLSGPPSAPVMTATEVRVVPGRFRGELFGTNPAGSSFEAVMLELRQAFGQTVPLANVTIRPECAFRGAAADEVELFNLYSALAPGETLDVDVQGIASGLQNEVAAFVIEVVSH